MHKLPKEAADQHGESVKAKGSTSIRVSNSPGYLCHISSTAEFQCRPELVFSLFANPDNTGVFRDIKKVTSRQVIREDPDGYRVLEIEQLAEVKVLWRPVQVKTALLVTEDPRDPEDLKIDFKLRHSDVLSNFTGGWRLQPFQTTGSLPQACTRVSLEQDVTPRGVPSFLAHVPVLGSTLRDICVRAVRRTLEDVESAIHKSGG